MLLLTVSDPQRVPRIPAGCYGYQWQSALAPSGPFTNIVGQTNAALATSSAGYPVFGNDQWSIGRNLGNGSTGL